MVRNGKAIREYVSEAKERQDRTGESIGKHFYADLRALFGEEGSKKSEMKVLDPSEEED